MTIYMRRVDGEQTKNVICFYITANARVTTSYFSNLEGEASKLQYQ